MALAQKKRSRSKTSFGSNRRKLTGDLRDFWRKIGGSSDKLWLFTIALVVLVALTGGSSRMDVASLIILRPFAFIALLVAVAYTTRESVFRARLPVGLCFAALLLIATQFIPIPYDLWATLPGRDLYADAARIAGADDGWRVITMSPARTFNALAALILPLAAMLLIARQLPERGDSLTRIICLVAGASALVALVQLSGDPRGPLYTYRLTTIGAPVGLFANRNHQAVFLAAVIPFLTHLAVARYKQKKSVDSILMSFAGAAAVFSIVSILTGSRAGFLALVVSAFFSAWIVKANFGPEKVASRLKYRTLQAVAASVLAVIVMVTISTNALVWDRFRSSSVADEERSTLLPTTWQMVQDFFPMGSGFGTFEGIYYQYEGLENLSRYYVNQAHMDWLQVALEGGLAAVLIVTVFCGWVMARAFALLSIEAKGGQWSRQVASLSFIVVFGFASLFDYPLRTPLAAVMFAVCCVLLAQPKRAP